MVRQFMSTVALVACASAFAFAGEHATFVLNSGERINGEVLAMGNGQLKLGGSGAEQAYSIDQVAAIDFVGGVPSALEFSRVPVTSAQAVVLRNGHAQAGRFVSINGDTLQWENDRGQAEQYALRDVARIYLNSQNARTAYNRLGSLTTVGTSGQVAPQTQTQDQPGGVRVLANQAWNDTGIDVRVGDLVTFQTTGQIAFGQSSGQLAGPDGKGDVRSPNYAVSEMPVGGLIGKIGNSAPFAIGSNQQPIRMGANGRLMLGVNDNELNDNSGYFSVIVRKTGRRR